MSCKILVAKKKDLEGEKVWCVSGDSFGEINSYYLTFNEAEIMVDNLSDEGEFETLTIYVGKET